jgi:hypothetical protein
MKGILGLLMLAFSATLVGQEFSKPAEKIYVLPEQVEISNNQILVQIGENILSVSKVAKDEKGLFVKSSSVDVVLCSLCNQTYDSDNQSKKCPHPWFVRD